jgi:hypothetical protein
VKVRRGMYFDNTEYVRRNTYGSYQSLLWGTIRAKSLQWAWGPTGTILHGVNGVFQSNRNYFPKVAFTFVEFEGIWGNILQLEVNKMV